MTEKTQKSQKSHKPQKLLPAQIEKRSFEIIEEELLRENCVIEPRFAPIVFRAIHASADFDYARSMVFSEGAVEKAISAMRLGEPFTVVTDTTMALAGIDKNRLALLGGKAVCFIGDKDVSKIAQKNGETRSHTAVDMALGCFGERLGNSVSRTAFVIGNAPTALNRLCEHIENSSVGAVQIKPLFVVGVPVGFVNVVESKERLTALDVPYITALGRKGGSNVAAAIMNALLRMALDEKEDEAYV